MAQSDTTTNPDTASVLENQDISGNVLDNDLSESLVTRIQASTGPFDDLGTSAATIDGTYGTLTISPDGSYTYSANSAEAESLADGEVAYDVFTYTTAGGQGNSSSETLTLTVTGTNDVPTVSDDSLSTDQNVTISFDATDLLVNDTDVDNGDTLSVVGVSGGADTHGSVSLVNGLITYVPDQDYVGPATFTYTVTDSSGATATGSVNVTVAATQAITTSDATNSVVFETRVAAADDDAEEGPTGGMKMPSGNLDMTVDPNNSKLQTVGVRFTAVDIPQGAVITAAYIQFEAQKTSTGSLSLLIKGEDSDDASTFIKVADNITSRPLTDASATWSPPEWTVDGESGPDQRTPDLAAIIQEIVDRSGWTALNDMVFVISGTDGTRRADSYEGDAAGAPLLHVEYYLPDANNLPVVVDDSASVAEDTNTTALPNPVTGNVLANDTDADAGDTHSVSAVNGSTANVGVTVAGIYGSLVINNDGSYTYTLGNSNPEVQTLAEGAVVDDVFTYTNLDNQGGSSSALLTISVTGTNDSPVATTDALSTNGNTTLSFAASDLVANDTDPDTGDTLSVTAVSGGADTHGTVSLVDGSITYVPDQDYIGPASFSYTLTDNHGVTTTGNVSLSVLSNPPVAVDDSAFVVEDTNTAAQPNPVTGNVLANDTDPDDGDTNTVSAVNGLDTNVGTAVTGTYGSLMLNSDGSFAYTLDNANSAVQDLAEGQIVYDVFTYTNSDNSGGSSSASLTISVTGTNDGPVAVDDSASIAEDTNTAALPNPVAGNVLANDTDEDTTDTHTVTAVNGSGTNVGIAVAGAYGFLTLNSDGSYAYALDNANPAVQGLAEGQIVRDAFTYTNSDNNDGSSSASLTITIMGTNDAPVAVDDSASVAEDTNTVALPNPVTGSVLANDTDEDTTDTHTVTAVNGSGTNVGIAIAGTYGSLTLNSDGGYSYTLDNSLPAVQTLTEGQLADDVFTYTNFDSQGASSSATLTIAVTGTNDSPTASDDTVTASQNTTLSFSASDLLTNDSDPDSGDTLTVTAVFSGVDTHGTVSLANGIITYVPDQDYLGPAAFTYSVADSVGATTTAMVNVTVASPSEPMILEMRIANGADDVEQRSTGFMYVDSSDLELVVDGTRLQSVGLRFTSVDIPQGAVITDAYIQFTAKKTSSGPVTLLIQGQDSDEATAFLSDAYDLTSRPLTDATVAWTPPDWTVGGEASIDERTPDMTAIIQEIVDRSGWVALNDMVVVISGDSGSRKAFAYEGDPTAAPLLHIEYFMPASGGGSGSPVLFNDPADTDPAVNQIAELAVEGTPVRITASASDADAGTTITYSIDDIRFDIDIATGAITRSGTGTLDFETESSITLSVTATSSDGGWNTQAYSLSILDSPERVAFNDPADADTANNRIYQGASAGTSVGITASALDPDAGSTVTYTIDDARLAIDPNTGVVTRSGSGTLDAQNEPAVTFNVAVTSSDGSNDSHAFTIDVINDQLPSSLTLMNTVDIAQWSPPSPDPAGIVYVSHLGSLLVSDSEVNEMSNLFTGVNLFLSSLGGNLTDTFTTIDVSGNGFSDEPTGVAYNPDNHHLFFSDDTGNRSVYELDPGSDGLYNTSDDVVTSFATGAFGCSDPEDVTYDTSRGYLYIVGGADNSIFIVDPGVNGIFDGVPSTGGDDVVTSFDTGPLGLADVEGIAYDAAHELFYVVDRNANDTIMMVSPTGEMLGTLDIAAANAKNPAGVALAPSSSDPGHMSLYIVDRGVDNNSDPNENDGRIYEFMIDHNDLLLA